MVGDQDLSVQLLLLVSATDPSQKLEYNSDYTDRSSSFRFGKTDLLVSHDADQLT